VRVFYNKKTCLVARKKDKVQRTKDKEGKSNKY
jgi:hypothetical protein